MSPTYREEICFIPQKRPLREMEDRITKSEGVKGVECHSWRGDALRDNTKPKNIVYLEHITPNQLQNIKHLVFGESASRSAFRSWRRGYEFSDKEEDLAEKVKTMCNAPTVCAFSIRGETKETQTINGFDIGKPVAPEKPFVLDYYQGTRMPNSGRLRDLTHYVESFDSMGVLEHHLDQLIQRGNLEIRMPYIHKKESDIPVDLKRGTLTKDKVVYITH